MKILFLGDYSNVHACLASALRRQGQDVTVISDGGGYMQTANDLTLCRRRGRLGSIRYVADILRALPAMKGYDVVQLVNTNFLSLRPEKIRLVFDWLRRHNGAVYLTLAGNDYHFVKACLEGEMFRYSEFMTGHTPSPLHVENPAHGLGWVCDDVRRWTDYLVDHLDGAMSLLPEYDMAWRPVMGDRVTFTNLPIELESPAPPPPDIDRPIEIFVGIKREMMTQKGTGILLDKAREAESLCGGRCIVHHVENLPLTIYLEKMKSSHIVLDQLYSYSPATNALQAMARMKVAGTGAQPEYYAMTGEPDRGAILSLSPFNDDITGQLVDLVDNPQKIVDMAVLGRRLVEKHNDSDKVASLFMKAWKGGRRI